MKSLKPRSRPSAEETLQAVATHTPSLPPARLEAPDRATTLNLRMRHSTVAALSAAAKARGVTMKQLVAEGIQALGIQVSPIDLEDRTPRRKDV